MRKVNNLLRHNDLSIESIITKPSNVISVGIENCDYNSLISAMNSAVPGDLILVFPGTYNLGTSSLILKNGVDIECLGTVIITSSNSVATITDNGTQCLMRLKGFPEIINTNALQKRIVLTNLNSNVKDFHWESKMTISQVFTNVPVISSIRSNLGITPTITRDDVGQYSLIFSEDILIENEKILMTANKNGVGHINLSVYDESTITITNYNSANVIADSFSFILELKIYP